VIRVSSSSTNPAVEIQALTVSYGQVRAVSGVDLVVQAGELVALLGPNGAGKSSLINAVLGLVQPEGGEVRVCGQSPTVAMRRGDIGVMLQTAGLPVGATVADVLRLFAALYGQGRTPQELVELAHLGELAGREVSTLSGGQAQRLRFAAALAGHPRLLFLDEPTVGMDVESRQLFWATVREVAAGGTGVLFATHYLEEADRFADRIVIVHQGQVVAEGTAGELKSRMGSTRIVEVTSDEPEAIAALPLPGQQEVTTQGRTVRIRTSDADETLRALHQSLLPFHDVTVTGSDLDDVLLSLSQPHEGV
jgi:ABC-2 type transport system ATP-binding protein